MNNFALSYPVGDPGGDDKQLFLYKAPSDSNGGGVTVLSASAVNGAALAGAGTTFTFQLLRYASNGTVCNGTVSNALGSDTQWGAEVPQSFTIDASYQFLDAGEWLVLDYQELNAGNPTLATVTVNLAMGK